MRMRHFAPGVAALLAIAGGVFFAVVPSVHTRTGLARAATSRVDRHRVADLEKLRAELHANRLVRRRLLDVKAPADALAREQSATQLVAFRAARDTAKPVAYTRGYRDGFPVALDAGSGWYSVHATTHGRYKTTSWTAGEGQEYVIQNGTVATYAPNSAPNPYLVGDNGSGYNVGPGDVPGYYNSQGNWVPSPSSDPNLSPSGATALCGDGTYSYSQTASGTCSWHGGVAEWNP